MVARSNSDLRIRVATCQLNQWALDFSGNLCRVVESIREAKRLGANFRTGPELELCGYGCEDHFLEIDTINHSWDSLRSILNDPDLTYGILCDIGLPVLFRSARYNCRVFCLDGRVLLVRPKTDLSGDGNYRESRYFAAWDSGCRALFELEVNLPHQALVPFGLGVLVDSEGVTVGSETCEELWTLQSSHSLLMLDGVDVIANGSASHHELRKLSTRLELTLGATAKGGGAYLYANQRGCDGGRLYFDGSALIALNGKLINIAPQFSLDEVTVVVADIDVQAVRSFRCRLPSLATQAAKTKHRFERVRTPATFSLSAGVHQRTPIFPTPIPLSEAVLSPMEEIAGGPAAWLWDYLRRSGAKGFFIPLSGGADSAAVATLVSVMCRKVMAVVENGLPTPFEGQWAGGRELVVSDLCRLLNLKDAKELKNMNFRKLTNSILHTCYIGTSNSSKITEELASSLAREVGSYHLTINIDEIINSCINLFKNTFGKIPIFASKGGTKVEDLALQNLQARLRMVMSYLFATLIPFLRYFSFSFLLVLGTSNVDESLRGYMTKYDCSSGDINPIGSISKTDLKKFLKFASNKYQLYSLARILEEKPTAELRPLEDQQNDEDDMGLTYEELSLFGKLRSEQRLGIVSMAKKLCLEQRVPSPGSGGIHSKAPKERIELEKVKLFHSAYAKNRHKMTVLTPSYHAEGYSPDDNRFDHRPFLYPNFERQFKEVDELMEHQNDAFRNEE